MRLTSVQENIEGNFEIRKTFEIVFLSLTTVRLTSGQENWGGMMDAARPTADAFWVYFIQEVLQNQCKTYPNTYPQLDREKA